MDSSTSSLNLPKLRYRVVSFPAHSAGYPATELEGTKNARGWQSIKNPDYPIEIGLMFENVSHIHKIQFLSHQYKISSSLDILVGNLIPPFDVNKINAEEDYKHAQFKLLGFMHLDDNSNTGYRARELKSVSVSAVGLFLKVILHKNHENKHNESNQVGLVAINVFGEQLQSKSDPSVSLPESFKSNSNSNNNNNGNAGTPAVLKQNLYSNPSNPLPNEEIARPIKNDPLINFPEQRSSPKVSEHVEISLPQTTQSETNSPEGLREKKEDFKVSNISSMDDDDSDEEEQDKEEEDDEDEEEEEENTETVSNETESNESEIDAMKQIKQILQAENIHKKEVPSHNLREQIKPSQQQQQQQANYIPQHFQHQPSDPVNPLTLQPNIQQIEPKNIAIRQPNQVREDIRPNTANNNTQPFDLLSWLRSVYLEQYYGVMSEQGYDNPVILGVVGEDDMDILGIVKPGHRKTFMRAINLFNSTNVHAPPPASTLPSTNANNNNVNNTNNPNNANIYNMKPQAVPSFNKQEDTRMSQQNIPHISYTLNSRPSTSQQYIAQFPHPIQKYNNPYAPPVQQVNSNPRAGLYGGNMNSNVGIARYQNREARAIIDLSMDSPTTHIPSYNHQNYPAPPQKYTPMYSHHEQDDDVEPVRNINRPPIRYESDPHQSYQEESYRPTQMNNRNVQPQDYKDYSSSYSSKSNSPSPPPRVFHNPSDDRPLPAISKTSFQDLTSASNQSINNEGENKRNLPPRESRERKKTKANSNNNNNNKNNESQEDERPRSVVGPNGELPPPSPLSDQKRAEATPLLNIWDETIITCLYSRTWALRQKALENINEWLKAGGDDESDGEQVFKACCTILSKCLEDKYPQIYLASLSLLNTLLTHYSPLANIPTHITRSSISNLLPPIVSKLGDSNTRVKDTSSDSLSEMAQILPNMLGPYQIGHSLTRPVKSQAQYRPVLGRLLLLKKLILEYGVGSNGSDELLELDETCAFISAAFESPNSEVRGKAVEVLVEVYKLKEKRAIQIMTDIKSKPLKEIIANEFAKIDPDKSFAKPTKGESSSSGASNKKKGGEPEGKKKLDRENNPREGGNIKNSSDESIESPKNSCQFCGESSPRFAVQEHLDLHYMQLCPVLCECECGQVVEVQSLNEHKLQECSEKKNYRTCKNCKAAVSHKEVGSHQKECLQANAPRTVFDICPLCYNYSKSLTSKKQWITHLLHCPSNARLPPPPSNSNKGGKPKK